MERYVAICSTAEPDIGSLKFQSESPKPGVVSLEPLSIAHVSLTSVGTLRLTKSYSSQ